MISQGWRAEELSWLIEVKSDGGRHSLSPFREKFRRREMLSKMKRTGYIHPGPVFFFLEIMSAIYKTIDSHLKLQ